MYVIFNKYRGNVMKKISLSVLNILYKDGSISDKSAYVTLRTDHPEVFKELVADPVGLCRQYPQMFDLFSAVLEIDDELSSNTRRFNVTNKPNSPRCSSQGDIRTTNG
jgi:hypothetical protein